MAPGAKFTRRSLLGMGAAAAGTWALAGCGTSPVGAGLVGSALNPNQLIFWNLFGGGDGTRMQTMEAGYANLHGGTGSLQATTFAWGNPYYTKVDAGHRREQAAGRRDRTPDPCEEPLFDGNVLLSPRSRTRMLASVGLKASDFNQKAWATQETNGNNVRDPARHPPVRPVTTTRTSARRPGSWTPPASSSRSTGSTVRSRPSPP